MLQPRKKRTRTEKIGYRVLLLVAIKWILTALFVVWVYRGM